MQVFWFIVPFWVKSFLAAILAGTLFDIIESTPFWTLCIAQLRRQFSLDSSNHNALRKLWLHLAVVLVG